MYRLSSIGPDLWGVDCGDGGMICVCCNDDLEPGDFPAFSEFRDPPTDHTIDPNDLVKKYGAMICHGCADAHVLCDTCGKPFEKDDGMIGNYPLEDYDFCFEDCHLAAQVEVEAEKPEYTWP